MCFSQRRGAVCGQLQRSRCVYKATTVVLWFLSGATAQIKYATGILRDIALAIPNTYGLSQMRGAVFAMDASVGGILSVQAGWLIMLGWLALAAMLAFALYHRKLACSVR